MNTARILVGDCRESLQTLPPGEIDTCVTSPPYWGLRDYGTADWEGGDPRCDHLVGRFTAPVSGKQASNHGSGTEQAREVCPHCGATRQDKQIGLEQTPEEYVSQMVAVFREVKRVLRDDGTVWLNVGDSYARQGGTGHKDRHWDGRDRDVGKTTRFKNLASDLAEQYKPKDLVGIPWLLAFALRADGWYLRQDIIWHKPNPMPESVTDRCTKAHEYIFLLSKSARYYYDHEAIKEPSSDLGATTIRFGGSKYGDSDDPKHATKSGNEYTDSGTRNKRSVWSVPPSTYKGAHFATYPPDLIEPCIRAGSRKGGTVLDPFSGSGTTGDVSLRLGRDYIGCELNPEYAKMSRKRIRAAAGMFGEVA